MKIYVVQKGDTLWEIANDNQVDFEEIIKLNPQLSSPDMIMPGMKIKIPSTSKQVKTNYVSENNQQSAKKVRVGKDERKAQSANRPMAKEISDVEAKNFPKQIISPDHIPEYPIGNAPRYTMMTPESSEKELKMQKSPTLGSLKKQEKFAKVNINEQKMKQPAQNKGSYDHNKHNQMTPKMNEINRGHMQMMPPQPMYYNSQGFCCYCLQPIYRPDPRVFPSPYHRRGPIVGGHPHMYPFDQNLQEQGKY